MTDLLIESSVLEDRLRGILPSDVDYASARLVDERILPGIAKHFENHTFPADLVPELARRLVRERQPFARLLGRLLRWELLGRLVEPIESHQERTRGSGHYVFSVCFFAAGKSTLFRIRRYPGEFG